MTEQQVGVLFADVRHLPSTATELAPLPVVAERSSCRVPGQVIVRWVTCGMRRRIRMVELAGEVCYGSLLGKRIAVLGAAFKPDSEDIRDSPALDVVAQL